MIYLIPMGGHGTRFRDAGYLTNKASIPTTDRHTGEMLPMVACAMKDLPGIREPGAHIICVDRDFHAHDGTEDAVRSQFPTARFIHDHVLLDQAFGCFLAREFLDCDEELIIGACDSGMELDLAEFDRLRACSDAIMFSHRGDENIARNPHAHSWAEMTEDGDRIRRISLKEPVSQNFMNDHATTGLFWFKRARQFLENLEQMIWRRDTLNGKYYVDKVLQYCIDSGLTLRCLDVRLLCWGTPQDYEEYQKTYAYWSEYVRESEHLER